MVDPPTARGRAHRLLREPTLHFLGAAALLFAVHTAVVARGDNVLEIDRTEIDVRIWQVEAYRGAALSPAERAEVEKQYIEEQILAREARMLGLDRDERINDILAQKMLHVLSGDVIQPTDAELEQFYTANIARYTPGVARTVTELVVPGATSADLARRLEEGVQPEGLMGDPSLIVRTLRRVTVPDLTELVGLGVAERIFEAPIGRWIGPQAAPRGDHWYRVGEEHEVVAEPLANVRDQVRWDWISQQEEFLLARRMDELRGSYDVRITDRAGKP